MIYRFCKPLQFTPQSVQWRLKHLTLTKHWITVFLSNMYRLGTNGNYANSTSHFKIFLLKILVLVFKRSFMTQPDAFGSFRRQRYLLCTNCLPSTLNGYKFLQYYTKQCLLLKFRPVTLWTVSARTVYVLHFHTNSRLHFQARWYTSRT